MITETLNSAGCLRSLSDLGFEPFRAIAQTLAIASTTIWNVLKKKETTGVLSNRRRTGRPRKTAAVDDRNIVKKDPNC